jgi:hypothetical protein
MFSGRSAAAKAELRGFWPRKIGFMVAIAI